MSSWMKNSFYFDDHLACFLIGRRDQIVFTAMKTLENDPEALEQTLINIIEERRPQLKGCMVHSICFNIQAVAWEIMVSHQSLPRRRQFDLLPKQWLDVKTEIKDTTLQDYMKANGQSWFAELTPAADVPLTVK